MDLEIEEIFVICMVFGILAFLVPYGLTELAANSSNAGDMEPFIMASPIIILLIGILIVTAKVLSK